MNFIAYEVATDEDGQHYTIAFEYDDPSRKFGHYDRYLDFQEALDRCTDISELDEFDSVSELEVSEDWQELRFEDTEDHEEIFMERTPDIYELLVG